MRDRDEDKEVQMWAGRVCGRGFEFSVLLSSLASFLPPVVTSGMSSYSVGASKVGWQLCLERTNLVSPLQSRKSGPGTNMALGRCQT